MACAISGCRLHDKSKVWKPCSTTPRALILEAFSWGNASTFYYVVAFVEIAQAHGCHTCGLGIKSFSKVSMLVLGTLGMLDPIQSARTGQSDGCVSTQIQRTSNAPPTRSFFFVTRSRQTNTPSSVDKKKPTRTITI